MKLPLLKGLALLHGGFGIYTLIGAVQQAPFEENIDQFGHSVAVASFLASLVGGLLLIVCGLVAWRRLPAAHLFAWSAHAAYLSPFVVMLPQMGLGLLSQLIPTFYVGMLLRILTAGALWLLVDGGRRADKA